MCPCPLCFLGSALSGHKGDELSALTNHRCVLGGTRIKPISVSSLIPFKSQVCSDEGAMLCRWRGQSVTEVNAFAQRESVSQRRTSRSSAGASVILTKLPEVRQAKEESILVFWRHQNKRITVEEVS